MGFKEIKCKCVERIHVVHNRYSKIKSQKSSSFCVTTSNASCTKRTALLSPSHYCIYCVNTGACSALTADHHRSTRTVTACVISLGSLTLPASEAADFVELILLFTWSDLVNALVNFGAHNCSI